MNSQELREKGIQQVTKKILLCKVEFELFKKQKKLEYSIKHTSFFKLFQLEEERQLTWGWGFICGPITTEDTEGQSDYNSGYHSPETEIISDSEDNLFVLDGELTAIYHCK